MNDMIPTALSDCIAKKHELAAEIARLQRELKAASELAAKWERTAIEIHDARMLAGAEVERLKAMTLWEHFKLVVNW